MDYDIKRGWYKNVEGAALPELMEAVFGNVERDGAQDGAYVSSYGVLSRIEVRILAKDRMSIVTESRPGPAGDEEILDSKRRLNEFAEKATGFNAKARMKRAQQKAKKGELRRGRSPLSLSIMVPRPQRLYTGTQCPT